MSFVAVIDILTFNLGHSGTGGSSSHAIISKRMVSVIPFRMSTSRLCDTTRAPEVRFRLKRGTFGLDVKFRNENVTIPSRLAS